MAARDGERFKKNNPHGIDYHSAADSRAFRAPGADRGPGVFLARTPLRVEDDRRSPGNPVGVY